MILPSADLIGRAINGIIVVGCRNLTRPRCIGGEEAGRCLPHLEGSRRKDLPAGRTRDDKIDRSRRRCASRYLEIDYAADDL